MSHIKECQDARPLTPAEFEALPSGLQVMLTQFASQYHVAQAGSSAYDLGAAEGRVAAGNIVARKWLAKLDGLVALQNAQRKPRRGLKAWLLGLLGRAA